MNSTVESKGEKSGFPPRRRGPKSDGINPNIGTKSFLISSAGINAGKGGIKVLDLFVSSSSPCFKIFDDLLRFFLRNLKKMKILRFDKSSEIKFLV